MKSVSGASAGWRRTRTSQGIILSLQVATSAYDARSGKLGRVDLALNDRQLRSLARDLVRAAEQRDVEVFARRGWSHALLAPAVATSADRLTRRTIVPARHVPSWPLARSDMSRQSCPMASRPIILARLGLLLPAVIAGTLALSATLAPRVDPVRIVRLVPPPQPRTAPMPKPAPAAPVPAAYVIRRVLPVPGIMRIGDTYWDEAGAPDGPVVITVDLQAKVLSIFRAGYEIGTAAILYGGDDKPTPLGVFPITGKDADHRSNIYSSAPMPYMMRLTNDGISIHGSPGMEPGLMTHGCVGVPVAFAKKLFGAAKLGTKVIVTNGERLDVGKLITAA